MWAKTQSLASPRLADCKAEKEGQVKKILLCCLPKTRVMVWDSAIVFTFEKFYINATPFCLLVCLFVVFFSFIFLSHPGGGGVL